MEVAMVRLDESKITAQGQISVPKKIREKLQIKPGDRVVFWEDEENGRIVLRASDWPREFTPEDWERFLKKADQETVTRAHGTKAALKHLDGLSAKAQRRAK